MCLHKIGDTWHPRAFLYMTKGERKKNYDVLQQDESFLYFTQHQGEMTFPVPTRAERRRELEQERASLLAARNERRRLLRRMQRIAGNPAQARRMASRRRSEAIEALYRGLSESAAHPKWRNR